MVISEFVEISMETHSNHLSCSMYFSKIKIYLTFISLLSTEMAQLLDADNDPFFLKHLAMNITVEKIDI